MADSAAPVRPALSRERIVDAARTLVDSVGHDDVSLRKVAAALDVTAPALYDHVRSKDELLRAVAELGYAEMTATFDVEGRRAVDRCRARARAYVDFARAHPEMFRVMFLYRPAGVAVEADNELAAASTAFESSLADIAAAIDDGDIEAVDAGRAGLTIWAAVHGVASIALMAPAMADSMADDVIDAVFSGLAPR